MNIQKIIISLLVAIFWLFFTISVTYFNQTSSHSSFSIPEISLWYNEFTSSWSQTVLKPIESSKLVDGKFFVDQLNYIDSVIFYGKNYTREGSDRNVNINIEEGLYLFDLYDISYNYSIKNKDFSIQPKSPWKFFIDSRNHADIKIFSFDSIINIALLSPPSKENMTSLVIYPHMFFSFNVGRNKFLKNADILRIESISKIFYVNQSFLDDNNELNQNFFSQLYPKNDRVALEFFKKFFSFSYSSNEFEKYDLSSIQQLLYQDKNLFWMSYIQKYFVFFLNKEKKIAYYKKNILAKLNLLFKKESDRKFYENIKNDIVWDLKNLENLSQADFQDFQKIIAFYYKNLLKINSIDYIESTLVLWDILAWWSIQSQLKTNISSFYLNKIYALVDNQTHSNTYLQENILTFLQYFLQENNLQLKDGVLLINENQETVLRLDYLSYFLKNILLYNVSFVETSKFEDILSIVNIYLEMNKNIAAYYKNSGRLETLIVEYHRIYNKFLTEMRTAFFQEELNERWLLVLNLNNSMTSPQLIQFDKIMKNIFDFYNKNKSILSDKNLNYNQLYSKNRLLYSEYYSALSNHPEYLIKYDKVKSDLLNAQTIFEQNQNVVLSKEELLKYMSQFQGIDVTSISYKIVSDSYYEITNIMINGEVFSFALYPKEFYRLDNLKRNGQTLSGSYELESIKADLAIMYKQVSEEEKPKYDFSRFFLNTFFNTKQTTGKIYVSNNESEVVEDRTITFFKRDKLFGDKGDFQSLKGFLDIKYDDVQVSLDANNQYNISIEKAMLSTSILVDNIQQQVIAEIRAQYVFSDKEHYFKNMYIKFYDTNNYSRGEEIVLFWGKEFRIIRKIDIIQIKEELNKEIQKILENN